MSWESFNNEDTRTMPDADRLSDLRRTTFHYLEPSANLGR